MSKPKTNDLQTIDLAALETVSGGKASASDDGSAAVMTALTGILDSLSSIASSNKNSGFSSQDMMLFMMLMQRNQGSVVAAPAQPTNWTWGANGGYWIVK